MFRNEAIPLSAWSINREDFCNCQGKASLSVFLLYTLQVNDSLVSKMFFFAVLLFLANLWFNHYSHSLSPYTSWIIDRYGENFSKFLNTIYRNGIWLEELKRRSWCKKDINILGHWHHLSLRDVIIFTCGHTSVSSIIQNNRHLVRKHR